MELQDTARAQQCMQGMYMVFLGDSTMTETVHDIVMLLSGLSSQPEALAAFVYNATRCTLCCAHHNRCMTTVPVSGPC